MKSPFNWVGNKYKFVPQINEIVKGKKYAVIADLFMGSGNILLNLDCQSDFWWGNDRQRLIPNVLSSMIEMEAFHSMEINAILEENQRFSSKESYYSFRDVWNKKYMLGKHDRKFVLETALLLKMCSNSMVRFNSSGEFNQGFRGLGTDKEFFKQSMLDSVLEQLNLLLVSVQSKNFFFSTDDFKEHLGTKSSDVLFVLDPPYAIGESGVYNQDFPFSDTMRLIDFIKTTKNDFIFFNYIQHGDVRFAELDKAISEKEFRVFDIGDNNVSAGQGGKIQKYVREVMVTNVHL